MLALSLCRLEARRTHAGAAASDAESSALCVAVLAYGGTLFGFGVWSRLLARYPAATVAPFALLVPVVGMLAARISSASRRARLSWARFW